MEVTKTYKRKSNLLPFISRGRSMYFCTIIGFRLGIWAQRFTTLMPVPLAEAGGFIIHLKFFWEYFGQYFRNVVRSCGRMYVLWVEKVIFLIAF